MLKEHMVIAGMGSVSAAGRSVADTIANFRDGKRNGGPLTLFPSPLGYPVYEVKDLPASPEREGMRTIDLTLLALDEALRDAGLGKDLAGFRAGVCLGTTVASQLNDLAFYQSYRASGAAPLEPVDRYLKGNLAEQVAEAVNANGPSLTVVNACSSGTDAVGVALSWLRADLCDIVIAGGADELSRIPYCGFGSLGIVSRELCAPFDRDRKGLNLGEGAGILVLEKPSSASRRGVRPELLVAGFGACADAYHLTAPHPDGRGLEAAIRTALFEAGIGPGDISFVNAHGTATPENDLAEGKMLAKMFGPAVKVLSTKGYTGHTLGAAGGLEAVFAALGLREGWVPASAGFANQDPNIPVTPLTARTAVDGSRYALSTSLAFGGNNAALVIARGGRP